MFLVEFGIVPAGLILQKVLGQLVAFGVVGFDYHRGSPIELIANRIQTSPPITKIMKAKVPSMALTSLRAKLVAVKPMPVSVVIVCFWKSAPVVTLVAQNFDNRRSGRVGLVARYHKRSLAVGT